MKKLLIGKVIEESSNGTCNWCGEAKEGFVSDDIKFEVIRLKDNFVLDWFNRRHPMDKLKFFSCECKTEEQRLYWATRDKEYETATKTMRALICKDCIKQLNKFIIKTN